MSGEANSKYSQEMLEMATDYLANFIKYGDVIPSIEGLAVHLSVARKTLYNWSKDEEKAPFLHILDMILAKQAQLSLNSGLTGDFNSSIAKLILGKHGYHDKQDVEQSGELKITEIKRTIVEPEGK